MFFNTFFNQQCKPVSNTSVILSHVAYLANILGDVNYNNKIHNIVQTLDLNKAHGHYGISLGY